MLKDYDSRWTPRKAQYMVTRDENTKKVKQQKWYLQMTVGELYR